MPAENFGGVSLVKTLIQNGTVVTDRDIRNCNLLLEDDRIAYIGEDAPEADRTVNAAGKYVFPGFIDTHTHLELSKGLFGPDTVAAALGGTTSLLEFAIQRRNDTMIHGYEEWMEMAKNSTANYGFHMSLSNWNETLHRELSEMDRVGISSYKMYMVYDGLKVDDGEIYGALKGIKEHGGILGCHCENWEVLNRMCGEVFRSGLTGPEGHPRSRPNLVEAEAVERFLRLGQMADAPVYIVHLSTKEGLEAIRRARKRGQEVYVETCPQYLLLTDDVYSREDGSKYVMSPPIRKAEDVSALWEAVAGGEIDTVGTDHCSFFMSEKQEFVHDFREIPNGAAGLEHRVALLYTYGVCAGRIDLNRMVRLLSSNAARIFGIRDRGVLKEGGFADIVIWDPNYRLRITDTNHHHNCDNSIYSGMEIRGRADTVFINGILTVESGEVRNSGHGRYLKRVPGERYRNHQTKGENPAVL